MKKYLIYTSLIFLTCFNLPNSGYSQTFTITHYIDYSAVHQNMWGPNSNPYSIDIDDTLFYETWNESQTVGSISGSPPFAFGAEFDINTWLEIGSIFRIHGFNNGWVDVFYPVKIDLTFPDDHTFNPGQTVTINTSYQVLPGWELNTDFPDAGMIKLLFNYGFGINADATICVFDCFTVPFLNINVPTDSITLFELNTITNEYTYPWWNSVDGFHFAHDTLLPIHIDFWNEIGLTGEITMPYVITTDYLDPATKCLYADGDSTYIFFNLDLIQFLSVILGPPVSDILSQLTGTIDLGGGVSIDYSLLTISLDLTSTMIQNFSFCPIIWTEFDFPADMEYTVTDPNNGNSVEDSGISDTIIVHTDYDLNFKYPCTGYDTMDIGLAHHLTNDFSNHTWDSIAFTLNIQAFEFWINLPFLMAIPDVQIPEFCVPVSYPCPIPADSSALCSYEECSPAISIPSLSLLATTIHIGPLIDYHIPLGYVPLTWFNETWELEGFDTDTICPGTSIVPNDTMSIYLTGSTVICFGDSTGIIIANVNNGTPPYTYEWSNNVTHVSNNNTDSIIVSSGIYYVTVTDVNGCSDQASVLVVDNPELSITIIPDNPWICEESSISLSALLTPSIPDTYEWAPATGLSSTSGATVIASPIITTTYTVTGTDIYGCTATNSVVVSVYPKPDIDFTSDVSNGCEPLLVSFTGTITPPGVENIFNFGDPNSGINNTSTSLHPEHTYEEPGTYDVSLYVMTSDGCPYTYAISGMITVYPNPVADFDAFPEDVKIYEPLVSFIDLSTDAYYWDWNFGDSASADNISTLQNTNHSYTEEGVYDIWLIVTSDHGCKDSTMKQIRSIDDRLIIPNVFSPNGDGNNDYFSITNIEKYPHNHIIILDRWGNIVYERDNYQNEWNGEGLSEGTYYYILKYSEKEAKGIITLIR